MNDDDLWDVEILDPLRPDAFFGMMQAREKMLEGWVRVSWAQESQESEPNGYDRCDRRLQRRVRTGTGIPS